MSWDQLADKEIINKVIEALKRNGIDAKFVETKEDAKKEVLSLISDGAMERQNGPASNLKQPPYLIFFKKSVAPK